MCGAKQSFICENPPSTSHNPTMDTSQRPKTPNLTNAERQSVYEYLLEHQVNGKLPHKTIKKAITHFKKSRSTISRIWRQAKKSKAAGQAPADVTSKKKEKCGRKRNDYSKIIAKVKTVPLNRRGTIRGLACTIDLPQTTTFRLLNDYSLIKRVNSTVKPALTDEQKTARLKFCLSHVKSNGFFDPMFNTIHIDEKWFYMTKVKSRFYLTVDEEPPARSVYNKNHITKVMFMAAVARPQFDLNGVCIFDGKIGIWPFIYKAKAIRSSKNRPAGTLETKVVESIGQDEIEKMMVEYVIPAMSQRLPTYMQQECIFVQQDNARTHLKDNSIFDAPQFRPWRFKFRNQPARSPDLNILDLGFFTSIQAVQYQASPKNVDELIAAVEDAYATTLPVTLNKVFLTLQQVMECIMMNNGENHFKIPHMKKDGHWHNNTLPCSVDCNSEAIIRCREALKD